jgi:hypothetical protein
VCKIEVFFFRLVESEGRGGNFWEGGEGTMLMAKGEVGGGFGGGGGGGAWEEGGALEEEAAEHHVSGGLCMLMGLI